MRFGLRLGIGLPALLLVATVITVALQFPGSRPATTLAREQRPSDEQVTVIVQLEDEPVAVYEGTRPLLGRTRPVAGGKLAVTSPEVADYTGFLERQHAAFESALKTTVPEGTVQSHYKTAFNGAAVTLPRGRASSLRQLPGVKSVAPSRTYSAVLDSSVPLINAPALWAALGGPSVAGAGARIAVVDTGILNAHPFLTDNSLVPPPGFPKGVPGYTSNKIIVAKVYTPAGQSDTPADVYGHGTHVAGIAAGVYSYTTPSLRVISGVAPKAFLMSYKVLLGSSGNGDTPEILRAIDDAVLDGADVINMSLGGPADLPLDADPLVTAIHNGTQAGVVFAVAAGNSGSNPQTILSPGIAPDAITVGNSSKSDVIVSSSSRGPNPDLSIKPDLTAPGLSIYSSVPTGGAVYSDPSGFRNLTGTSMATPHVAGAVALLRRLHPGWAPQQLKSALMNTAKTPVLAFSGGSDASVMARGAGRIDLQAAMSPGLAIDPPGFSFGTRNVPPSGFSASRRFVVTETAGISGTWTLALTPTVTTPGLVAQVSLSTLGVAADGSSVFTLSISGTNGIALGDYEGYITLGSATRTLHIPYWVRLVSLGATKTADLNQAAPNQTLTYTLVLANSGGVNANLILADPLPSQVLYVTGTVNASAGLATYYPGTAMVGWNGTVMPSQPVTVSFQATMTAGVTDGQQIRNYAVITDGTGVIITASNSITAVVPNLSTSSTSVSAGSASPGDVLTYTIALVNTGSGPAISASMTDSVPVGATYVGGTLAATSGMASYDSGTGQVRWNGSIPVGQSVTVTFRARLNVPLANGLAITNTVSIDDGAGTVLSRSASTSVSSAPDLSPSAKTVSRATASPGNVVTYTVSLANSGTENAGDARVTDTLPVSVTYVNGSVSATSGSVLVAGGVLSWAGSVNVGQPVTLSLRATINGPQTDYSVVTNTAQIADGRGNVLSRSAGVTVINGPDLSGSSKSANSTVSPGCTVAYTIGLVNSGSLDAVGSRLTDTLPEHVSYVPDSASATSGAVSHSGGVLTWGGVVTVGIPVTITFRAAVSSPVTSGTSVTNTVLANDGQGAVTAKSASSQVLDAFACKLYLPGVFRTFTGGW